jgi:hypothetical protein
VVLPIRQGVYRQHRIITARSLVASCLHPVRYAVVRNAVEREKNL